MTSKITKKGVFFIISGPSGAGKTTLCRKILAHFRNLQYSVSYTTRSIRRGEQNGEDYFFITETDFKKRIKNNQWVEWAKVHGNYYGTCALDIDKNLATGQNILLDIDVQGTAQILRRYPESITIFVMPPSMDILQSRLQKRSADDNKTIMKRLKEAQNEIRQKDKYKYVLINDKLNETEARLIAVIEKYLKN